MEPTCDLYLIVRYNQMGYDIVNNKPITFMIGATVYAEVASSNTAGITEIAYKSHLKNTRVFYDKRLADPKQYKGFDVTMHMVRYDVYMKSDIDSGFILMETHEF